MRVEAHGPTARAELAAINETLTDDAAFAQRSEAEQRRGKSSR